MKAGIVSDIHAQPAALRLAIEAMGPIDTLICLGDAINQARFCNETIGLLRDKRALTILGNHEEAFFAGPGARGSDVDGVLADWLAQRPRRIDTLLGDLRVVIVHSTPWPSGHAYVPVSHRDFHRFAVPGADVVLYGHTHQPLVREIDGTLVINPGSVGEGRPTTQGFIRSCAMLDVAARDAVIIDLD